MQNRDSLNRKRRRFEQVLVREQQILQLVRDSTLLSRQI